MGLFSRKKRPDLVLPKTPVADHGAGGAVQEEWVPAPDPGRPESDLTQRMFGMMRAAGMSLVVHGPGSAEDCFQAVTAAAPVFGDSGEVGGGFGTVNGPGHPWMIASGPSGSVFAFFLSPDADIHFFTTQIADRLKNVAAPWRLSTVTHLGTWPRSLAEDFVNAEAQPMWTLTRFARHRPDPPPEPSVAARTGADAGQRPARFGNTAGNEFLFVEHVRHNPPGDSYDTWDRINDLGGQLRAARGSGFEHCVRDADDRRLDPDWLSTRSMAVHPSATVLSASHLNHAALSCPPALDLGAIDMRNLHTFRDADRPQGMVSPHHSLYRGSVVDDVHEPRRMIANALSVDLHSSGVGAVVESWGGQLGAVALVETDGRYRHLTFLEGMSGGETVQLSPDGAWVLVDGGGSRAWLVEVATGNWMPSPVENAGWWPGRDSCLLTFQNSRPTTPVVFDLSRNRVVEELAPVRFARASGVDFLDRGWHPRVAADGQRMLFLTAAGIPADHQREHGSGSRSALVDLASGHCDLVTDIFVYDSELERDHTEVRWLDDRWHGDVRLHSDLRAQLRPPAALDPEHDDPAWLASDVRQVAGLALQTVFDELRSDPGNADAARLMPEIIRGLDTTARLYPPHWDDIADWAGEIADFLREPLQRGWLNDSSHAAWERYVRAVDLIARGSADDLLP